MTIGLDDCHKLCIDHVEGWCHIFSNPCHDFDSHGLEWVSLVWSHLVVCWDKDIRLDYSMCYCVVDYDVAIEMRGKFK